MTDSFERHIRTLPEGWKIDAPGFWRIPMSVHHSQCCEGVSVTSSVLRRMELHSPAEVWAFHALNPDRWPDEDRTPLRMGRAMAAFIEGGQDELERHFWVLPSNKPNKPTAAQLKAIAEGRGTEAGLKSYTFWQKVAEDPRDIVTATEWELICAMGGVLSANPMARSVLSGEPEITMAFYDERSSLWVLSRPDNLAYDGTISDYKKISLQGRPMTSRLLDMRIDAMRYDMQMALAHEAFEWLTGERPQAVGLVFQSDKAPHHVKLHSIDEEDLEIGRFLNHEALMSFRECLDSGLWPGPGDSVESYRRSDKAREYLLERMNTAGSPL